MTSHASARQKGTLRCDISLPDEMSPIAIRCVTERTRQSLIDVLGQMRISLGGSLVSPPMHRIVSSIAVQGNSSLFVHLAIDESDSGREVVAGFVIATRQSRKFWRSLYLRHPAVGVAAVWHRLKERVRRRWDERTDAGDAQRPADSAEDSIDALLDDSNEVPYSWDSDDPAVVRVTIVGVLDSYRKRGIGEALYAALASDAQARGAGVLVARVSKGNLASLRLHHASGWRIVKDDSGYFAYFPIVPTRSLS